MTKDEFLNLTETQIRNDERLMLSYIDLFKKELGYTPTCVPCSFKSDYKKLINHFKTPKMASKNTKYELKKEHQNEIFTFRESETKIHRCYGYNMTDEFAENWVKAGKDREKYFSKIPKKPAKSKK